jgi:hypothetical protein
VNAPSVTDEPRTLSPSLPICVARALLEVHGTSLVIEDRPKQIGWRAGTTLDRATQPDFFATMGRSLAHKTLEPLCH